MLRETRHAWRIGLFWLVDLHDVLFQRLLVGKKRKLVNDLEEASNQIEENSLENRKTQAGNACSL
jgi:hypothetical protein